MLRFILLVLLSLSLVILPSISVDAITPTSPDVETLIEQGRQLYKTERFSEAAQYLQKAAIVAESQSNPRQQATALSNLSLAYQQLGQWSLAEQAIGQSLQQLKKTENGQLLAQALEVQGQLQFARSQADLALASWQAAAEIYAQLSDRSGVLRSRINAATALQVLGLYRQAEKTLDEMNQTLQTQPDSLLKAVGLRQLGTVLRVVGEFDRARQVLEQSLTIARAAQSATAIDEALLALGNIAIAQGDSKAAAAFYQQAAKSAAAIVQMQADLNQFNLLARQGNVTESQWTQVASRINALPASRTAIYARIELARNLKQLKQRTTATTPSWLDIAKLLSTAVEQAKTLDDQRATSYALGSLGGLYEQTQQRSEALNLTQEALLLAQTMNAPDVAYQWQWQLGRLLRTRDNSGAIAAYTEAINTLTSLRRDLVAINPDVQFSFREEVEPVYREFVDLLLNPQASQNNLKQARDVIESLQLAELDNFFREACLEARVEIDQVADQETATAVIYPIILDQRLEIIVKFPQQELRHYTTAIAQSKLEKTVAALRQSLPDVTRSAQVKQHSQQIYDWLIQPLETDLMQSSIKTLVFVLDGVLRNIPMAVLYNPRQETYLIEQYAIALTPGLRLVQPKPLQQVALSALTAGISEKRRLEGREFAPLDNVDRELDRIQSEVPKSKELLNQTFTQANLQQQLKLAPFSVVHLATHGEFSSNPDETFILTWDQLLKVRNLDTLLRSTDQRRASPIELLVLSACKTAEGDDRAALGLAGVAVRAGARSTLASLWSVDDESTAEFMSQFYQTLRTGATKAEALQQAQRSMLASENRPYFWAPYVLVGNWL